LSDYTKLTSFDTKDALSVGDPLKRVKGTELDDEFDAIAVAVATKANSASPSFTGTPTAPTATAGTSTTQIATTAFVNSASTSGNAATATAPASGGTFVTSSNIGSQSVSYASTSGNGGVTSVNGATGAVTVAASIGSSQSWQAPSRSQGTEYTNSTGRPIMVNVYMTDWDSGFTMIAYVNGLDIGFMKGGGGGDARRSGFISFIVPPSNTYQVNFSNGATGAQLVWRELR
jgi:hypothetical protein